MHSTADRKCKYASTCKLVSALWHHFPQCSKRSAAVLLTSKWPPAICLHETHSSLNRHWFLFLISIKDCKNIADAVFWERTCILNRLQPLQLLNSKATRAEEEAKLSFHYNSDVCTAFWWRRLCVNLLKLFPSEKSLHSDVWLRALKASTKHRCNRGEFFHTV